MCASDVVAGSALLQIKLLEVTLLVLLAAAACFSPPALSCLSRRRACEVLILAGNGLDQAPPGTLLAAG